MYKIVVTTLAAIVLAGCSTTIVKREIRTTPEHEHNQVIEKRVTFMRLVEFIRVNQHVKPTEELKKELHAMITLTGLRYSCYSGNRCFLHKEDMKIQIHPEYVYIEYPDKSYRKIYDPNDAIRVIYS
jgi:hypothetical protein